MGRKSKAVVRKQEILSHFYQVIIDEGFEGASIAKIAKRMDVNPSLIIHYFSTKEAMVLDLIAYIISTYSEHILPDFSEESNSQDRWGDVLDVVSRIDWERIMNNIVFYSCYTLGLRDPKINEQFVGLYQRVIDQLVEEIQLAHQANIIQVQDPRRAAEMMLTLVEGANFLQHVTHDGPKSSERAEQVKASIMRLLTDSHV
ncbi:MAG: TetR/AcrR family transcriptional regulator [Bacteroidota bacterium]